ncbi:MAG: hypothetical protein KO202_04260 [Methanobacteriaceae archaeon]|jgi:hypothetical protein|nr:hypothetical protein [Methanobacteriaceae archaeon]
MKAGVLYSGGKDSSLIAFTLKKLGFDVELCTANFGVYDSYLPAQNTAKILGFDHKILKMDFKILDNATDVIIDNMFPNEGINIIHKEAIEYMAQIYPVVADGTRRDDKTPKFNKNQIRSLEDKNDIQYINLDSFGYKSINFLTSKIFELSNEKSNKDNNSDYEVEIRILIDEKNERSCEMFPEHYQSRVIGYK